MMVIMCKKAQTMCVAIKQTEAVKKTVIANQCAHWCGNPLFEMFRNFRIFYKKHELFGRIPTALNGFGKTVFGGNILFDTLKRLSLV